MITELLELLYWKKRDANEEEMQERPALLSNLAAALRTFPNAACNLLQLPTATPATAIAPPQTGHATARLSLVASALLELQIAGRPSPTCHHDILLIPASLFDSCF
jgi:hypothetical protein